jgi:putative membrane protein
LFAHVVINKQGGSRMPFLDLVITILLGAIFSGLIIWIVGRLGIGLEVDGYGPAYLAAIVIAVLSGIIVWFFGVIGFTASGWFGALVDLLVAGAVILTASRWIKGIRAKGYVGAIVAAIAIAVVGWIVMWILSLF